MLSVQVNLRTISKNITAIKRKLSPQTKFCAVVKANAYGFGLVKISRHIQANVDYFAVANLQEAITLRQAGIKKDILIFGITNDYATATKYDLTITIESLTSALRLAKSPNQPRIHLAVNTDMNRFGFNSIYQLRTALQILKHARVTGIYTHLAHENDHPDAINTVLPKFRRYYHLCQKYFPNVLVHAGCSGVIDYPTAHFQMIRIGKGLYGGAQGTETAITVTSRIVAIQKIRPGESVGYQSEFIATKPMVIGIVSGGYANGIVPQLSGKISVRVGKHLCPLIARVCMDYCFIDVSNISNPIGQSVTFISPHPEQTLLNISQQSGIIPCVLLLSFNSSNGEKVTDI